MNGSKTNVLQRPCLNSVLKKLTPDFLGAINCLPWIHIKVKNSFILPELGWIKAYFNTDAVLTLKWSWSQKMIETLKLHKLYHPANVPGMSKVICAIKFFHTQLPKTDYCIHSRFLQQATTTKSTCQLDLPFRK